MKAKNKNGIFPLLIMGFIIFYLSSCEKDNESINTVTDRDGNVYNTGAIGTQVWMTENLKTTKFSDGSMIPLITGYTAWSNLTTAGYCWYGNDSLTYNNTYGALYNWYTVSTCKLCPTDWHVPTDAELKTLTDYLTNNGYGYQGSGIDIAKSMVAKSGWSISSIAGSIGNDQASNNRSSFTAFPGGSRNYDGTFSNINYGGYWWSSTKSNSGNAWQRNMHYIGSVVYRGYSSKTYGFSVRCIRDF
jgi:uncharacterized protein (TIGR02145 family)